MRISNSKNEGVKNIDFCCAAMSYAIIVDHSIRLNYKSIVETSQVGFGNPIINQHDKSNIKEMFADLSVVMSCVKINNCPFCGTKLTVQNVKTSTNSTNNLPIESESLKSIVTNS